MWVRRELEGLGPFVSGLRRNFILTSRRFLCYQPAPKVKKKVIFSNTDDVFIKNRNKKKRKKSKVKTRLKDVDLWAGVGEGWQKSL